MPKKEYILRYTLDNKEINNSAYIFKAKNDFKAWLEVERFIKFHKEDEFSPHTVQVLELFRYEYKYYAKINKDIELKVNLTKMEEEKDKEIEDEEE